MVKAEATAAQQRVWRELMQGLSLGGSRGTVSRPIRGAAGCQGFCSVAPRGPLEGLSQGCCGIWRGSASCFGERQE